MHWIAGYYPEHSRIRISSRTIPAGLSCCSMPSPAAQEELHEADLQLQKQYDLLEKGIYDEETFFERSAIMKKKKSELTSRLKGSAGRAAA